MTTTTLPANEVKSSSLIVNSSKLAIIDSRLSRKESKDVRRYGVATFAL